MKIHDLKTDPVQWAASNANKKPFELRFNDRDYQVGDRLRLHETVFSHEEMSKGAPLQYTGRILAFDVRHIVEGYGLLPGWVCMGLSRRKSPHRSK